MVERHYWLSGHEVKWKSFSSFDPLQPHGLYSAWNSPDQNTGVGYHFHPQGNFPNQGLNPDLSHLKLILYSWATREAPIDMSLSKVREILKDRETRCAAVHGSQRVRHDWVTEQQQKSSEWYVKLKKPLVIVTKHQFHGWTNKELDCC